MISFKEFFNESRFSDREYYNPESPWRLTEKEYLIVSNKGEKFHYNAYEPKKRTVTTRENPPVKDTIEIKEDPRSNRLRIVTWVDSKGKKREYGGINDFLVWDVDRAYDFLLQNASGEIVDTKEYIDYHFQYSPDYTIDKFPIKLETVNGIEYRYDKKHQVLMAFLNGKAIGMASDEWGAYLVTVDPNYRGKGIGSKLAHLYLAIKKRDSGGYTQKGIAMAKSVHRKAVNDAIKLGWYERAERDGILTKEKIKEIKKD